MTSRNHGVRSLLDALRPADEREAEFIDRMRALSWAEGCFNRNNFQPGHFTASAFVLSPDADALLLIHHRKLGRWLQPGGHIDPEDADPLAGALREVSEETGVAALGILSGGLLDADIHDIPAHKTESAHQHFDLRFLFRAEDDRLTPTTEVADARWFPLETLSLAFTDESVLRALRKIRARL